MSNGAAVEVDELKVVRLEEFLAPQELKSLALFTLRQQQHFVHSQVVSQANGSAAVDAAYRRSGVLFDLREQRQLFETRLRANFSWICDALRIVRFPSSRIEVQLTASNDGDLFRPHNDNTHQRLRSRKLTFVYFFCRDPLPFSGGELRIYGRNQMGGRHHMRVTPQQNLMVIFPSHLMHEVTLVRCPSRAFVDSRFTVNGWFHAHAA